MARARPTPPAPPAADEEAGLLSRPLLAEAPSEADAAAAAAAPRPPPPPQRLRPITLTLAKPPDWFARGLRVALALLIFLNLEPRHILPPGPLLNDWADEVRTSIVWAAATTVVVAASPLIGKVAQVSFERTLGTVCGGFLGVMAYDLALPLLLPASAYPPGSPERQVAEARALSAFAAAIAVLAAFLSNRLNLDQSMRLMVMNFLLVVRNVHEELGSLGTAVIRTSGILAGVYLYSFLAVVVLPKSASVSALRHTKAALEALAGLNAAAWASLPPPPEATAAAAGTATTATTTATAAAGGKLWRDSQRELAAGLSKTYACVAKVEECAQLARRERYVWHFWGHFVFVPKILPWGAATRLVLRLRQGAWRRSRQGELGGGESSNRPEEEGGSENDDGGKGDGDKDDDEAARRERRARRRRLPFVGWRLPQRELDDLLQSASRAARLVWALHLSFQDGFDAETLALLRRAFEQRGREDDGNNDDDDGGGGDQGEGEGPDLLRRMQASLGAALSTLARAFPAERALDVGPLQAFSRAVEAGLDLDAQERERRRAQRRELEALLLHRETERERRRADRAARFEVSAEGQWAEGLAGGGGGGGLSTPATPRVGEQQQDDKEGEEQQQQQAGAAAAATNGVGVGASGSVGVSGGGALLAAALAARLAARERRAAAAAASGGVFGASFATTPLALGGGVSSGSPPPAVALRRAHSATLGAAQNNNNNKGKARTVVGGGAAAAAAAADEAAAAAAAAPGSPLPPAPLLDFPSHAAEVRWASLLFVADELADELETLYLAAGAVMETLPSARV